LLLIVPELLFCIKAACLRPEKIKMSENDNFFIYFIFIIPNKKMTAFFIFLHI